MHQVLGTWKNYQLIEVGLLDDNFNYDEGENFALVGSF